MNKTNWPTIDSAPKDGTRFIGRSIIIDRYSRLPRYEKHQTWYGKASHVPMFGWCYGKVENVNLWEPTHWKPMPQ